MLLRFGGKIIRYQELSIFLCLDVTVVAQVFWNTTRINYSLKIDGCLMQCIMHLHEREYHGCVLL